MGIKLPHTLASAQNCNTEFKGLPSQSSKIAPKYVISQKVSIIFSIGSGLMGYRENGKAVRYPFFAGTATFNSQWR